MASCYKYRLLLDLLSLQSIPIVFSICHNFVHFTLSKAFSKSTKHMYSSLSCSKLLSQIEHSHNTYCFSCTTAFSEIEMIFPKEFFCFCCDSLCKNFQNNFCSMGYYTYFLSY